MQLKIVIYLNKEIHIEVQLEKRYAKYYSLLNSHMIIVKHVDRSSSVNYVADSKFCLFTYKFNIGSHNMVHG